MRKLLLALALAGAFVVPASAQNAGTPVPNFQPNFGRGQTLSVTTSSVSATTFTTNDVTNTDLYVYNAGAGIAYARWGNGAQTATASDVPLPPGSVQVFYKGTATDFAAISASGTNSVLIITGKGR